MKNVKKQAVNDVLEYLQINGLAMRIMDDINIKSAKSAKYDKIAAATYDAYKHLMTDDAFLGQGLAQAPRGGLKTGVIFAAGGASVLAYQRLVLRRERMLAQTSRSI